MLFTQLLAQTDDAGAMAAIAGMGMLSNVIGLALFVFIGFCQFTIAKRVGLENPWFAFIPILNIYQMTLLAGKTGGGYSSALSHALTLLPLSFL